VEDFWQNVPNLRYVWRQYIVRLKSDAQAVTIITNDFGDWRHKWSKIGTKISICLPLRLVCGGRIPFRLSTGDLILFCLFVFAVAVAATARR
jgi:hypothetical protein